MYACVFSVGSYMCVYMYIHTYIHTCNILQEKVVMQAVNVGACKATILQVAHRLQSVVGSDRCVKSHVCVCVHTYASGTLAATRFQ